jgi:pyridoxine 5-phosphate synthase
MTKIKPIRLGVNVDHVATVRNARGGRHPDPVQAAKLAITAGAAGITVHLREDRRHITDDDVHRLRNEISAPLNLELAATREMLDIALAVRPHAVCIVPEKRTERTTEGGLEVARAHEKLAPIVSFLAQAGVRVSLFIEPDRRQVEAAAAIKAAVVELHTGAWCEAIAQNKRCEIDGEFERIRVAATQAAQFGLEVHAGHGLDFASAEVISALPEIVELNIGHYLIGEAIFSGLEFAIRAMRAAMDKGRSRAQGRAA